VPGKAVDNFRVYHKGTEADARPWDSVVTNHYRMMRSTQTHDFAVALAAKYAPFDKAKMTIGEAFEALKGYVDSSDPDTELPNKLHMLQTAGTWHS
jgi:inositol oxygenase